MALELHILGPAFGLPSIDPECTAAAAFLQYTLEPRDIRWKLIPNHDASISPSGKILMAESLVDVLAHLLEEDCPFLCDNSERVAGFTAIVKYISSQYPESVTLNAHLTSQQRADSIAFTTFLTSNALPLLDLSFYMTFENYYNLTRPAFSAILPWHANYAIPPARREAARARTQHLGLSSLDVDTVFDDFAALEGGSSSNSITGQYEAVKRAQEKGSITGRQTPSLLPLGRKKLSSLFGGRQTSDRFKLERIANEFFEPLAAQLGKKHFLLSDEQPSSLDYLAFGYLALMLYPDFPRLWLRDTVAKRFPSLYKYTSVLRELFIGKDFINVEAVMKGRDISGPPLPWQLPAPATTARTVASVGREILYAFPMPRILSYIKFSSPPGSTRSTITRILTFSSFAFSILAGVAYHFATTNPASWDYDFKSSDFVSEAPGSQHTIFEITDPEATLTALERFNSSLELDASQGREKERLGGAVVGEVDVNLDVD